MTHVLLLTDNNSFNKIAPRISCPSRLVFNFIILTINHTTSSKHHIPAKDFKRILHICRDQDVIIVQVTGSRAIYLMDVLLGEKEFFHCHFIILQSPLIHFRYQPSEEFFVDWAIRRKLQNNPVSFAFVRPFTDYYIPDKYHHYRIQEALFFRRLLAAINNEETRHDVTYFLPGIFPVSVSSGCVFREKLLFLLIQLLHFWGFVNLEFYHRWNEEGAMIKFLRNVKTLPNKILIT